MGWELINLKSKILSYSRQPHWNLLCWLTFSKRKSLNVIVTDRKSGAKRTLSGGFMAPIYLSAKTLWSPSWRCKVLLSLPRSVGPPPVPSECLHFPFPLFSLAFKEHGALFNVLIQYWTFQHGHIRTQTHVHTERKKSCRGHAESRHWLCCSGPQHAGRPASCRNAMGLWKRFSPACARYCSRALIDRFGFYSPLWSGFRPGFMEDGVIYGDRPVWLEHSSRAITLSTFTGQNSSCMF